MQNNIKIHKGLIPLISDLKDFQNNILKKKHLIIKKSVPQIMTAKEIPLIGFSKKLTSFFLILSKPHL